MDVNEPITNPALLKAIEDLSIDNSTEPEFIEELQKAQFLCPVKMDLKDEEIGENGEITLGKDTTISILSLDDSNGDRFLMAFTDWDELRKWDDSSDIQTLMLTYDDYQTILGQEESTYKGAVINPYGANIVIFNEKDKSKTTEPEEETVTIGIPKDYPTKMVDALIKHFETVKSVKSAYILSMIRDNDKKSYLLIVESEVDPQELFPILGIVCDSYLKGIPLEMAPLNSEFARNVIRDYAPFYLQESDLKN